MLSEISQSEKDDEYHDFIYRWNPKNKINEQTKLKQTHRHREPIDGCQSQGQVGALGEGLKKYEWVVTKQSWGCKAQHREYSQ